MGVMLFLNVTNIEGPADDVNSSNISVYLAGLDHNRPQSMESPASLQEIIGLSVLFFLIGFVGIVGNALVMLAVLSERKMRTSVTNLLITNLAFADLVIMMFGVPEIVQFMMNRGWLLSPVLCKVNRYALVISLYASVLILMAVCIERYIAIIEPIKTHIFCSRRRLGLVLFFIWPTAMLGGLPTLLYNTVAPAGLNQSIKFCMIIFPADRERNYLIFKYAEFGLFYFIPMCVQIILYVMITKRLFLGSDKLHRRLTVRNDEGQEREKLSDAIRARHGVVKMLIASVMMYFLSYSPQQIMLFYNTFSPQPFHETWSFLVSVMIIAYINSAVNPILYGIFSQNFRRRFKKILMYCTSNKRTERRRVSMMCQSNSRPWRLTSLRTANSEL